MNDLLSVIEQVRRALGRTEPLATPPVPPAIDESITRLVRANHIGLPELFMERAGIDIRQVFYTHGFFLAYVVTVFALARLVFRGFERPMQDAMRHALPGR